jgi:nucleolar protein 16
MVRYGRKIKQRDKVKVTRKQKPLRKFKTRFVRDANVKDQWNHSLTTRQNYERIGLQANPNAYHTIRQDVAAADGTLEAADEEKLFHVPDSDLLSERNHRRPENYMSEEEIKYLRKLIAKHGENFKAMERDIKTNNMQWTESKLKTRCARLALLDAKLIQNAKPQHEDEAEDDS